MIPSPYAPPFPALPFALPLAAALALSACAGTGPVAAPPDPAVAERARAAGLLAEARAESAREAAVLALRAPRMAYPILVPSGLDPAAFRLDGATVDDDGEEVYYALRYRRPDGACFTITGGAEGRRRRGDGSGPWRRDGQPRDSATVEIRALHTSVVVRRSPDGVRSAPIEADGLGVTFSSSPRDDAGCRPVSLEEAAVLVGGLRLLDPADDLEGAYRPLDLGGVAGRREGEDSESLARMVFALPGSASEVAVETVRRTERRAVVLVTNRGTGGNAVRDEQIRAVFVHGDGGAWRLVSAGQRVRCRPGHGHEDWSPASCG